MSAYRLPRAHRRKILRMRAVLDDPSQSREVHAEAGAYLKLHASCEAFLQAQAAGRAPSERPRCAQGYGKSAKVTAPVETRICPVCNKQKAAIAFDDELGKCIKCKYKKTGKGAGKGKKGAGKGKSGSKEQKPAPTRTRKCPVCLQGVTVTLRVGDWTVEKHTKQTRDGVAECSGGGQVLYRERRDAMDLRVPGNFEGGKRR